MRQERNSLDWRNKKNVINVFIRLRSLPLCSFCAFLITCSIHHCVGEIIFLCQPQRFPLTRLFKARNGGLGFSIGISQNICCIMKVKSQIISKIFMKAINLSKSSVHVFILLYSCTPCSSYLVMQESRKWISTHK